MLQRTTVALKKGWTHNPGRTRRGGKNLAWRPKMSEAKLQEFVPMNLVHPGRHPNTWQERQFNFLGYTKWPKELGFYNAGDNFELTPDASLRIFQKCKDEPFWSRLHNEKTIVYILPNVEVEPEVYMAHVSEVHRHHLKKFGADHYIYNAVMQACAFAKNFPRCEELFKEMTALGLEPNAQTYVNMMFAAKMCGLPREKSEEYFKMGVTNGAIFSVTRLDTELTMWMDQFDRLGSFTAPTGHLSVNVEGASPMPRDMWALWGWHKSESKFVSRHELIAHQVRNRVHGGKELVGTVYAKTRRQPWAKFNGMLPADYRGPPFRPATNFADAPPHESGSASTTAF